MKILGMKQGVQREIRLPASQVKEYMQQRGYVLPETSIVVFGESDIDNLPLACKMTEATIVIGVFTIHN